MNLSGVRAKILSHAFLQADAPASEIAKESGSTEKTVRKTLSDLIEAGVIRSIPVVNIHALGLTDYCIFITLASDDAGARLRLFEFFKNSPNVAWLAELSGDFHFSVSIMANDIFQIHDFFDSLSNQVQNISIEKYFALRLSWTSFRCKYFAASKSKVELLSRSKPDSLVTLDKTDHLILRALTLHAHEPYSRIARSLNMSNTTFNYRVSILRQRGILLGTIFYLDAAGVGMHPFRIILYAKNPNKTLANDLFNYCFKHPNISAFIECLGNWDYEINLEVFDPAAISSISQELYEKFGKHMRIIKAVSVLRTLKTAPYPFLN